VKGGQRKVKQKSEQSKCLQMRDDNNLQWLADSALCPINVRNPRSLAHGMLSLSPPPAALTPMSASLSSILVTLCRRDTCAPPVVASPIRFRASSGSRHSRASRLGSQSGRSSHWWRE
jgi:hypothetical protein